MKTLAAVLKKINQPLEIMELDIPPLGEGQVLVKIEYAGLCHTQLNEIQGKKGEDKYLPHTLGHEGSGIVLGLGQNVSKVSPGDHVVLSWISGTGYNSPSTKYLYKKGVVNSGSVSTFLTHAVVSENRVVKIPKEIPFKEAALLGCALPTGMGIVLNNLKVRPGNSIAVFGVGGIGMCSLIASKLMHASKIIAIDLCDQKLSLAKKLGATHTINATHEDCVESIFSLTEGKGLDYSIESAGNKIAMETAFKVVKNRGGICVITGNLPLGDTINIDPFDLIQGKRIIGTWGGGSNIDFDVPLYSDLFKNSVLDLSPLITHEFPLKEINSAIKQLKQSRGAIRCLIKIGDSK